MSDFEDHPPIQEFRDKLDAAIWQRIKAAKPIELLAPKGDSVLQVVKEPDGRQFVTRSFCPEGVRHIESCGRSFGEAWEAMQDIFERADIPLVRTGVVVNESADPSDCPIVMVSEYSQDNQPLVNAPTQTKKELANKLPGLFRQSFGLMLSPEVIRADMFKIVTNDSGEVQVMMIDVDPLMIEPFMRSDGLVAHYIERFSEFMWDNWCIPEERAEVITEFIKSTSLLVDNKLDDIDNPITRAFMNAHMMSQGLDYRELGLKSY